jgi:hypothetical protein
VPQTIESEGFVKQAFEAVCKEAKPAGVFYVAMFELVPYYGGPEEGGWWGEDNILVAYQRFDTQEAADAAKEKIEELAADLSAQERTAHGEYCLRTMEWLDDRGLDADFLPEDDGPSEYYVTVTDSLPESSYGCRHYS